MLKKLITVSVLTAAVTAPAVNFADSVVSYAPGTGYSVNYTNPAVALGVPALTLDYQPQVDPFNPPYSSNDLVSVGAGGLLTLAFSAPLADSAVHPFGLDFIIYGHDGFVDTNWPNGQTDGSLFSSFGSPGVSKVFASVDGVSFFELRPPSGYAATLDTLFPTDGAGLVGLPVNPALTNSSFANLDLNAIRALYNGSAGGTGFDLAWAVDTNGSPVTLPGASYVKIEVSANNLYVDAVASTVPEPATWALLAVGAMAAGAGVYRRR